MRVEPLVPDAPASATVADAASDPARAGLGATFGAVLHAAAAQLERADAAEDAFVRGVGGMQEMVVERTRADIALQVAATGAQRAAQALNTLLGMQI